MSEIILSPESRPLGKSGLSVSPIAWGMWRFKGQDVAAARARVEAAFEAGIAFFDTADIYGPDNDEPFGAAELLLGRVFAEAPTLRQKMVLASKGGIVIGTPYNSSRSYIESAIDASLKRMGVDHIDLWQVHRPDLLTHPAVLAEALEAAKAAGKIGAIGVSNSTVAQTRALMAHLDSPLASVQPEFSAMNISPLDDGTFDLAMEVNLAVMAWSPLGGGRLMVPEEAKAKRVSVALQTEADAQGVSLSAAAIAWVMAHPVRPIPIIGSQTVARIKDAAEVYKVQWTRQSWYKILIAARGEPLP